MQPWLWLNSEGMWFPAWKILISWNFRTALGEPRKPWRRTTRTAQRVRALPSFLTLGGSQLSSSEARRFQGSVAAPCPCQKWGECCQAEMPLSEPREQTREWHSSSPLWNTAVSHAEPVPEAGEIHGHFPELPNLADIFFIFREHKHIQKIWW